MMHVFELHEFFHSPKNVHLKALLYFNTPKEAKTTKKSQQNACSDFIQTFLHPEETGPVSIITFFISIKKMSSLDSELIS